MDEAITLKPIGYIASRIEEMVDERWGKVISRVVLLPEYEGGLDGLGDFSHVIIITYLHKAKYEKTKHLKRRPRGLASMPLVGFFAQRAKDRPNPIGIIAAKLVNIGTDYIEVQGLDAVNGTPVLDIKPYFPQFDRIEDAVMPVCVNELMKGYF